MKRSDPAGSTNPPRLRLRLVFSDGFLFGPGKADLLEHIAQTGSISAAGRKMKMSYKRAWMLVEALNSGFSEPLVESTRGGAKGGGARLTAAGEAVLGHYRTLEKRCAEQGRAQVGGLMALREPAAER